MSEEARAQLIALGVALLLVKEIPAFFSSTMSTRFTIASFAEGSEKKAEKARAWIRSAEVEGSIQAMFLGIGGSILTRSPWPFLLAVIVTGWKVYTTELALREEEL